MSSTQAYIVSARKYRPSSFSALVGQRALAETLKNSISSDRLAQAYLFCGPRGVGKTSCARIFAKTINCMSRSEEGEACGECESCRSFSEGSSYNIVELDAASNNSVDNIRALTEQVRIAPQVGRYRVFIIDEVHMLSAAAFNAFLKTLEEPPAHVVFILATTEKQKILPTILSRCQIYDFNRIGISDIVEHLQAVSANEGITAEPEALNVIARKADGAMRDALSIFDQVAASSMGNITYQSTIANLNVLDYDYYFKLVDAFVAGDVIQSLLLYKEVRDAGFDSHFFVDGLAGHVRDLMVAKDPKTLPLLEATSEVAEQYSRQAKALPIEWYYRAMDVVNDCDLNYRNSGNKQFLVELTLIKLCRLLQPQQPAGQPTAPQTPAAQPAAPTHRVQMPQSRPISAPQTRPMSTVPRQAPRTSVRPTTVRISGGNASKSESDDSDAGESHPSSASQHQRNPFTSEKLMQGWHEFMAQNQKKVILINTMRAATPTRVDDETYTVCVENPVQADEIHNALPELLPYLRNVVGNDMLALKITQATKADRPKLLTPQEVLQKLAMQNPLVEAMLQNWELELVR